MQGEDFCRRAIDNDEKTRVTTGGIFKGGDQVKRVLIPRQGFRGQCTH